MPRTPTRILLISPEFYGFESEILVALKDLGYDVSWINNKELPLDYHGTKSKFKTFRRIYFFLFFPQIRYLKRELSKLTDKRFDILFSINCHIICPYLFRDLRKNNPEIKSILFLWDSSLMYLWERKMKYFDKAYSFDRADSLRLNIEYKPNFYIDPPIENMNIKSADFCFIGKLNIRRFQLIESILQSFQGGGINDFIYLWSGYKNFIHHKLIYKLFSFCKTNGSWLKEYTFNYEVIEGLVRRPYINDESIDYKSALMNIKSANVILDIPFKHQTGYSHGFIAALASGRKIITTNINVRDEIFYDSNQIHLLDENKPEIDFEWVNKVVNFNVHDSIRKLEIHTWLKSVLSV